MLLARHALLMLALAIGITPGAALDRQLIGYWTFEGHTADAVGDHDGKLSGKRSPAFLEGRFGHGAEWSATDQTLVFDRDNGGDPLPATAFTLSFWLRNLTPQVSDHLILGDDTHWQLHIVNTGEGNLVTLTQKDWELCSAPWPADLQFHHVVLMNSPEGLDLYIDGDLEGRSDTPLDVPEHAPAFHFGLHPEEARHAIDDLALWDRRLTAKEVARLWFSEKSLTALVEDLDDDRLPDFWELRHGLTVGPIDDLQDPDGDGFTNYQEWIRQTHPLRVDTDGDGLSDRVEDRGRRWISARLTGTDPRQIDSDGDGLADGEEDLDRGDDLASDPNHPDTDGDGWDDRREREEGKAPLVPESSFSMSKSLIAYWPFDRGLEDVIGRRGGQVEGSKPIGFGVAQFGQGLLLNGRDQFIEVSQEDTVPTATGQDFNLTRGVFTISCWIELDTTSSPLPTILSYGGDHPWQLLVNSEGLVTVLGDLTAGASHDFHLRDGRLHHLVAIHHPEGKPHQLFVDGYAVPLRNEAEEQLKISLPHGLVIGSTPQIYTPEQRHWKGLLDDLAIWNRALSEIEIGWLWNCGTGRSLGEVLDQSDADEDGLPDVWERQAFGSLAAEPHADADEDGLTNLEEFRLRTHPLVEDTDGDGISDSAEIGLDAPDGPVVTRSNPKRADSDQDGLPDDEEWGLTDPRQRDSDDDGWHDAHDLRPNWPHAQPALTEGLLHYWGLEGDLSEWIGTAHGRTTDRFRLRFRPARFGAGLWFDKQSPRVRLPLTADAIPLGFSLSLWFSHQAHGPLWTQGDWRWVLDRSNGAQTLGFRHSRSDRLTWWDLEERRFHHLLVSVDAFAQVTSVYVDGRRLGDIANTFLETNHPLSTLLGSQDERSGVQLENGWIDDLAIWNRPLNFKEAKTLYQNETALFHSLNLHEDVDEDLIPDRLERYYVPDDEGLRALSREGDFDGDGFTDADEVAAGLDPTSGEQRALAHFKFDESSPSHPLINQIVGSPTGTYVDDPLRDTIQLVRPGLTQGHAVSFNDNPWDRAAYAKYPLSELSSFTVSLWIKKTSGHIVTPNLLFGRGNSPFTEDRLLALYAHGSRLLVLVNGELVASSDPALQLNRFQHIALTLTENEKTQDLAVYVDTKRVLHLESLSPRFSDNSRLPFTLGGSAARDGFVGLIDDAQIYERPLSPEEMQALYEQPGKTVNAALPTHTGGERDSDRDGMPDIWEWIAGTDPEDALHLLRIAEIGVIRGQQHALHWWAEPNRIYEVEYAPALDGPWETVAKLPAEETRTLQKYLDTSPQRRSHASGFYRLRTRIHY